MEIAVMKGLFYKNSLNLKNKKYRARDMRVLAQQCSRAGRPEPRSLGDCPAKRAAAQQSDAPDPSDFASDTGSRKDPFE
jgi:hypothetical protein